MIPMVKTGVSLEAIKSKPKIRGKLGSRGTNSCLPFGVNMNLKSL